MPAQAASLRRDFAAVGWSVPIACSLSPLLGWSHDGECPESTYRGDDHRPSHSFSGGHGTLMRGIDSKPSLGSKVSPTPMCHQPFGTSRDASAHKNDWMCLCHLLDSTVWG